MTVAVIIITHGNIGKALLNAAKNTLENLPMPCRAISIKRNADPDVLIPRLQKTCEEMDQGDGVLVLTDMFGSTPSNLSNALREQRSIHVVAGLNLPMLIRVLNYSSLPLDELREKAFSGGREGVLNCECPDDDKPQSDKE